MTKKKIFDTKLLRQHFKVSVKTPDETWMHQLAAAPLCPHLLETSRFWFSPLRKIIWADEDFEMSKATEQKPGC